jgi:DNA processing protein
VVAACRHSGSFEYPEVLAVDPEPPWVIWLLGNPALLTRASFGGAAGIVGSRRSDAYGNATARDLGRAVARSGGTVISGLAFGIDAAAHRGALDIESGHTIAVTGGGVDVVYPKAHNSLHQEIVRRGLVLSEMPPGAGLWKWSFPARNRLIAALSRVVVVVQGAKRSGSLHTAEAALTRGRALAAVPGRIDSKICEGSNQLIADGAAVISSSLVLTRMLGLSASATSHDLGPELKAVATAVSRGSLDAYMADVGTARVSAA